jgi:enterochelin esterase-like enzyme
MLRIPKKPLLAVSILVFIAILFSACSYSQSISPTASTLKSSAETAQSTADNLTPTPTVPVCTETNGVVSDYSVPSKILTKPIAVKVYTPPCYDRSVQYPVLYMLHGMTFLNDQWVRLGITSAADELIMSKEIAPMIIVMPQEDESLSDPGKSKYGDALINEVIPWVDQNLSTCNEQECRAIGGLSRGGNWAVRIGLSNPDLFAAIGAHSTPLFYSDLGRIGNWLRDIPANVRIPQIYMDMGKSDENREDIRRFDGELNRLKVIHEFYQFNGLHDEVYWSAHVRDYLRWYARVLAGAQAEVPIDLINLKKKPSTFTRILEWMNPRERSGNELALSSGAQCFNAKRRWPLWITINNFV